eukprot:8809026-Alexandrium_andersonii.AAC.1
MRPGFRVACRAIKCKAMPMAMYGCPVAELPARSMDQFQSVCADAILGASDHQRDAALVMNFAGH